MHALAPGFPGGANGIKNLPGNTGDARDVGLIPGLGRFPWSRKWRPAPVFLAWEIPRQSGFHALLTACHIPSHLFLST